VTLLLSILTSRLTGPIAAAVAAVLATLLALALVAAAAANGRINRLAAERDGWKTAAAHWEAGLRQSEVLRAEETATARAASAAASIACDGRVAVARRSARAIQSIVQEEVSHDANGCPARGLVPVERLRDALAPAG